MVTWPQAVVAIVIILAVIVGPQVVAIIQNVGIKRKADTAAHEVLPNSGKSLADAVNRIERKIDGLDERVSNLEENR